MTASRFNASLAATLATVLSFAFVIQLMPASALLIVAA